MLNKVKMLIKKVPKFEVGDSVRISKYKNIFAKKYTANWPEEVFIISKINVISNLNGEPITGTFNEKELQNTRQKEYRREKVIKRKSEKLYIRWKGYDISFNSWIDKKDIV